jgi:hypothetical protein
VYCPNDDCPDFVAFSVRGEYHKRLVSCPRCKALLLPGSPPTTVEPTLRRGERQVRVASFEFEHQANLAVSFLASKGIVAFIASDDCGRTDPVLGFATGGVRLMVPESQAQEAILLLESDQTTGEFSGA